MRYDFLLEDAEYDKKLKYHKQKISKNVPVYNGKGETGFVIVPRLVFKAFSNWYKVDKAIEIKSYHNVIEPSALTSRGNTGSKAKR